jgi:hypothetical protein
MMNMGSHHDGDETEGSVHSFVQDYHVTSARRSEETSGELRNLKSLLINNLKFRDSSSYADLETPLSPESRIEARWAGHSRRSSFLCCRGERKPQLSSATHISGGVSGH